MIMDPVLSSNSSLPTIGSRRDMSWLWRFAGRRPFWIGEASHLVGLEQKSQAGVTIQSPIVLSGPQVSLEVPRAGCGLTDGSVPSPDGARRRQAAALTACWFRTPGPGPLPAAGLKLMCLCVQQRPEDTNHTSPVLLESSLSSFARM